MSRAPVKIREAAKHLFLTNQMTTNADIAAHLHLKPHTVGTWRKQEDWDTEKATLCKQAAEGLLKKIGTDRIALNLKHYRYWELLLNLLGEYLKGNSQVNLRDLERAAGVLERVHKGQRLARGLNLDGQTEELIRAEAEADNRNLVNLFLEIVKEHITDEQTRNRLADALAEAVSEEEGPAAETSQGPRQH